MTERLRVRELLLGQLKYLVENCPTIVPGYFTDDIIVGELLIGASAAVLLGYYANKAYNKPTISLKDTATCLLSHAGRGLGYGIIADLAWYSGSKMYQSVFG
jgi:hypothetical protein